MPKAKANYRIQAGAPKIAPLPKRTHRKLALLGCAEAAGAIRAAEANAAKAGEMSLEYRLHLVAEQLQEIMESAKG